MMKILAALVILSLAAGITPAKQVTCRHLINCPCGSTGKDVKVCVTKDKQGDPCRKLSKCKDCQDGLDGCLECPDGMKSSNCSTAPGNLSRKKRQYYSQPYGTRGRLPPSNNRYQRAPRPQEGGSCPELRSPKLGSIRCLTSERQTSCVGECLPGYSFEGHESIVEMTLTCRRGYYTPLREFPPCKSGGHCDLVVQGSGSFNCTTGMEGTRCDVICNGRFIGRHYCYPEQEWKPSLPSCVRPKEVSIPRELCECQYGGTCDSNGSCVCPVGRTGKYCETIVPDKKTCSDPGFVTNGVRRYPDQSESTVRRTFEEGESVIYSCISEEYALRGSPLVTCKNDGQWSSALPHCVRTSPNSPTLTFCRDPGVDPNGSRRPSSAPSRLGFPQGSRLEFSCKAGYIVDGEPRVFCLTSGIWSSGRPRCGLQPPKPEDVYCLNPGLSIPNGRVLYYPPFSARGSQQPQTALEDPEYPKGGRVRYSCDVGYTIVGSSELSCEGNGMWSSVPPVCIKVEDPSEPVLCLNPGDILNGRVVFRPPMGGNRWLGSQKDPELPVGGIMSYSCDNGYILEGSNSLTCEEYGLWSSEPPVCKKQGEDRSKPVLCLNPGDISNGRVVFRPPNGGNRWSGSPNDPEFPVGGIMSYSCDNGYVLEGSTSLTCEKHGLWSSVPPICKAPDRNAYYCPDPGVDPNGTRNPRIPLNRQGFPHGTKLEYHCNPGYELIGNKTLFCLTGRWLSEIPKCNRSMRGPGNRYCPNPGSIPNGRVEYYPSLNIRRPTAPQTSVDEPEYPEGGQLRYSCNNGYRMEGLDTLTCNAGGYWSGDPPACVTATPVPSVRYCVNREPVPTNAIVKYVPPLNERTSGRPNRNEEREEYPTGSRLEYSCHRGFSIQGKSANRTCEASGSWSAPAPYCITSNPQHLTYCVNPGPILNGQIEPFAPPFARPRGRSKMVAEDTPEYPEGTKFQYKCDPGFLINGKVTVFCETTGTWSDPPPKCESDCGRREMGTTVKIKDGNQTKAGEWPWAVAIAVQDGSQPRIICGGALISPRAVLTAAHCLTKHSRFILYFGKYYRSNELDDDKVKNVTTSDVIIHDHYNNSTLDSDIALIKFKPRLQYSERVKPICLPSPDTTMVNLEKGQDGVATGWGLTEKRRQSEALLKATLPFVENGDCRESFRKNVPNFNLTLTQNMFCAGYLEPSKSTVCRGDSGSPLVFYDSTADKYTIEGLVSFTVEGQCGVPATLSIFTKVYNFLPWILKNYS